MPRAGFFLILLLFSGIASRAQLTMFEGKVFGEDGLPLKGAIVQLKWKQDMIEARSDDDGLFYTTLIPTGMYRLAVEANGKYYKMKGLKVLPSDAKKYYYVRIHGGRLFVDVEGMDPFLKSKVGKLMDEDPRHDVLCDNCIRIKRDTLTGKYYPAYGSNGGLPPVR